MYKKIFCFIVCITILVSTNISIVTFDGTVQPYEEMEYNYDLVSKDDWENTEIGEYPIDVDSEIWSQLSYSEAAAACDMPKEYAESLTTEELVDYAVNYPFLMDIFAYDNFTDGMNHLVNKSSVFEELFSRVDCYDELIAEYLELDIDYEEVSKSHDVCDTNYDIEVFIEIYLGLNYDLLSYKQAERFIEEYEVKFSSMNEECQESSFSTFVYDAIDEKMGAIPTSAIPENLTTKFVHSSEECTVATTSSNYKICSNCQALVLETFINVNGKDVLCYEWISGGMTAEDILNTDNYVTSAHPSFYRLRSASSKYNCHSYAWYSESYSNVYWINDPSPIYENANYWLLLDTQTGNLQADDRITFWSSGKIAHSAIAESSTVCRSKLGHWGIYRTTISEMESFYGASSIEVYTSN